MNENKSEDSKDDTPHTITNKYITKLYKDQSNSLDVRWNKNDSLEVNQNRFMTSEIINPVLRGKKVSKKMQKKTELSV